MTSSGVWNARVTFETFAKAVYPLVEALELELEASESKLETLESSRPWGRRSRPFRPFAADLEQIVVSQLDYR